MNKSESLIKSIIYRIFGTVGTFLIALVFTGKAEVAGGIAVVEIIFKTAIYYSYERLWEKFAKAIKK